MYVAVMLINIPGLIPTFPTPPLLARDHIFLTHAPLRRLHACSSCHESFILCFSNTAKDGIPIGSIVEAGGTGGCNGKVAARAARLPLDDAHTALRPCCRMTL